MERDCYRVMLGAIAGALLAGTAAAQDAGTTGSTDQTGSTVTVTTATGSGTTSGTETGTATGAEAGTAADGTTTTQQASAYDKLSRGGRKIADALFDGQTVTADGANAWSHEDIALAKQDGEGWGQIFQRMKREGLTDAKNLGELVSGRYRPGETSDPATATTGDATAAATDGGGTQDDAAETTKHRRYTSGKSRTYASKGASGSGYAGKKVSEAGSGKTVSGGARRYGKSTGYKYGASGKISVTTAAGSSHGGNHAGGVAGGKHDAGIVHGNGGGGGVAGKGGHNGHGGGKGRH